MNSPEFRERLLDRAEKAGVLVPRAVQDQLEAYFGLLARWNSKINLTALPLLRPTDETFDRLLVEPLAAARYVPESAHMWFDLGSGGGSPAIPLKVVRPAANLTMVESRARKAAFLREVVRVLGLLDVIVANERVEQVLAATKTGSLELVTIRALRVDTTLLSTIARTLSRGGRAIFFHSSSAGLALGGDFEVLDMVHLGTTGSPILTIACPMFHVEQHEA